MKFKIGDKVHLKSSATAPERIKNADFGIVGRTSRERAYLIDRNESYLIFWKNLENKTSLGSFHWEEDLELDSDKLKVDDYVLTKKEIVGKIIRITPKSYELRSLDNKIFMVRSHNVVKIEL